MKIVNLKSTGAAKLLIRILFLLLATNLIAFGLSVAMIVKFQNKAISSLTEFYDILDVFNLFIFIVAAIVFIAWIHRLHKDLKLIYPEYPITYRGAMTRLLIPFYNIWGFWDIFKNVSRHFSKEVGSIHQVGKQITKYIPLLYTAAFVSDILAKAVDRGFESRVGISYFATLAASDLAFIVLIFVWMKLACLLKDVFIEKLHLFSNVVKHPIEGYTVISEKNTEETIFPNFEK